MNDELLYTQEDLDEWIRTCELLQEKIVELESQISASDETSERTRKEKIYIGICVFSKYKIKVVNNYSFISDYEFNEPTFDDETEVFEKIVEGGELMEMIAKDLNDKETISFLQNENTIQIEKFNPFDGTGSDIIIQYEEIKETSVI